MEELEGRFCTSPPIYFTWFFIIGLVCSWQFFVLEKALADYSKASAMSEKSHQDERKVRPFRALTLPLKLNSPALPLAAVKRQFGKIITSIFPASQLQTNTDPFRVWKNDCFSFKSFFLKQLISIFLWHDQCLIMTLTKTGILHLTVWTSHSLS